MKIALCLFGEPRDIHRSYNDIINNIIAPNNIEDIFIHAWHTSENIGLPYNPDLNRITKELVIKIYVNKNTPQEIINTYNPKSIRIDKHLNFQTKTFSKPDFACEIVIPATQSMLCSINRCWNLLEEYEAACGTQYDAVVFTRPDIILKSPIDLSRFDLNQFTCNTECSHSGGVNYWMGLGNRQVMKHYAQLFHNMKLVFDTGIKFIPEIVVGRWIEDFGKIKLNPILPSYGVLR